MRSWLALSATGLLLSGCALVEWIGGPAPASMPVLDADLVQRGAALFSDRRLSGDGSRSCASCHPGGGEDHQVYRNGESVEPGTPGCLPPMAADLPKNRLGLARWLIDPRHPLTARVAVTQANDVKPILELEEFEGRAAAVLHSFRSAVVAVPSPVLDPRLAHGPRTSRIAIKEPCLGLTEFKNR